MLKKSSMKKKERKNCRAMHCRWKKEMQSKIAQVEKVASMRARKKARIQTQENLFMLFFFFLAVQNV